MHRLVVVALLLVGLSHALVVPSGSAQEMSCAGYDAWEWAQTVYESDPEEHGALDDDGDGIACPELPRGGFAPATWTDEVPDEVEEARLLRVVDGDTFEVELDGVSNRVRIYRADTPETQNERHCGGEEATAFLAWALGFNDNGDVVYLERDENERDQYGRELAYVWFEVDGDPYLLNHVLINNGWAEDVNYGDERYDEELEEAAEFAERHELGVWGLCGGFEIPLTEVPEAPPTNSGASSTRGTDPAPAPIPAPDPAPAQPAPAAGCDPSYPDVCVPAYPPDVNCRDVPYTMIRTLPPDPHGLDGDSDGWGCEG